MVLIVEPTDGNDEKTVVFSDVATHECGRTIRPRLIGEQELFHERFLQIRHLSFVEFQERHILWQFVGLGMIGSLLQIAR